jgi:hypothetical protein
VQGDRGRSREELTKSGRISSLPFLTGAIKSNIWSGKMHLACKAGSTGAVFLKVGRESLVDCKHVSISK